MICKKKKASGDHAKPGRESRYKPIEKIVVAESSCGSHTNSRPTWFLAVCLSGLDLGFFYINIQMSFSLTHQRKVIEGNNVLGWGVDA